MIRVNLLAVERTVAKKKLTFKAGQQLTVLCSLILVGAVVLAGWRTLALNRESAKLDTDIAAAQKETSRLHSIIQRVQQFEQQKAQLQQRVVLIEQLRKSQIGPVHMLDQISRSLPPMLWLTELKQNGSDVTIEGRCTTLTGLTDFVANLQTSGYFKKTVEIVNSQTETIPQPPGELIKFALKASFDTPGDPAPVVPVVAKKTASR